MSSQYFKESVINDTQLHVKYTKLLHSETTDFQKVEIYQTEKNGKVLVHDDVIMLFEKHEESYHEMLGLLPLFYCDIPKDILIIGGGDGGTARDVLKHPDVKSVTQVEIDGRVVELCKKYFPTIASSYNDPRMNLIVGDAVTKISDFDAGSFDAVLVDSTDPAGPSLGLFTKPFYTEVNRILRSGGVVAAQGECIYTHFDFQKQTIGMLKSVFENVEMYMSHIPFYPPGSWSLNFASNSARVLTERQLNNLDSIQKDLKYLNKDLLTASFALPEFAKDLFNN